MSKSLSLKSLAADLKAENEGEMITVTSADFPKLQEPIKLKVRSTNYTPFNTAVQSKRQSIIKQFGDAADAPADELAIAMGEAMAEHILLGWDGIDEEFTPALAREILTDPAQRDFRGLVLLAAGRVGQREVKYIEAAAKNSAPPSATA